MPDKPPADMFVHIGIALAFVRAQLADRDAGHLTGCHRDIADIQRGIAAFGLESQMRLLCHVDQRGAAMQELLGALGQRIDGQKALCHASSHFQRVMLDHDFIIGFDMRRNCLQDAHRLVQQRLFHADELAVFHDGADALDARFEFLLGCRADDYRVVAEESFLHQRSRFAEVGFDGTAKEAMNQRQKQDAAPRRAHPGTKSLLVAIQQGSFADLHQVGQAFGSFVFRHQQRQTVGQGALADSVWTHQDDMPVHRLREHVDHVPQQVFAEMHGTQLSAFCPRHIIDRRAVRSRRDDLAGIAVGILDGFGRDAELTQDAPGAHRRFRQNSQRVVGVDFLLVHGIGDRQPIVQQDDRLTAERDFAIADGDEVQAAVGVAPRLDGHAHLPLQALQVDAALAFEVFQHAPGCRIFAPQQGEQDHLGHDGRLAIFRQQGHGVIQHGVHVFGDQVGIESRHRSLAASGNRRVAL